MPDEFLRTSRLPAYFTQTATAVAWPALHETIQLAPFGTLEAIRPLLPGAEHEPPPPSSTSPALVLHEAVALCTAVLAVTIRNGGIVAA
jgi:hypothetical protein